MAIKKKNKVLLYQAVVKRGKPKASLLPAIVESSGLSEYRLMRVHSIYKDRHGRRKISIYN